MRICIDTRMKDHGGIGTVIKQLVPSLRSSFDCTLINPPVPIYSIREQWILPREIPKCDLFWSPHYNIPLLPIRAKKRIVTIHDACHLAMGASLSWQERLYAKNMLKWAASRSDAIVTDSIFSQNELSRYLSLPLSRFRIIYPGVDIEKFEAKGPHQKIKEKYALPDQFFIYIGNVKPHKNLKLILNCYDQFSPAIPIVIIGKVKGLLNSDPLIKTTTNPKIHFLEQVPDEEIPSFYQMATALIFPSYYEGFGLPPLEAMAAGCPAIVSNRASMPEVCANAACFIDPDQPSDLLRAMKQVIEERDEFVQKGRKRARQFKWESTAEKYIELFRECHEIC